MKADSLPGGDGMRGLRRYLSFVWRATDSYDPGLHE